jgi:hypothetical protein
VVEVDGVDDIGELEEDEEVGGRARRRARGDGRSWKQTDCCRKPSCTRRLPTST